MKLGKFLIAGILIPALVSPAIAASAVRPAIKPVLATSVKQDRSLVNRSGSRAAAAMENENSLIGIPLLFILAGLAATVALVVVVADDDESVSPGS